MNDVLVWMTPDQERLMVRAPRDRAGLSLGERNDAVRCGVRMLGDLMTLYFRLMVFNTRMPQRERALMEQAFNVLHALSDMTPKEIAEAALASYWEHKS